MLISELIIRFMQLSCQIIETELQTRANYFVVIQAQTETKTQASKFRTEIFAHSSTPKFYKNSFRFSGLDSSLGISIKFGLFKTTLTSEPKDQSQVIHESKPCGVASLKLSQKETYEIELQKNKEYTCKFINGKISFGTIAIKLTIQKLEVEVKNNLQIKKLEDVQFNPYQTNQLLMSSNISKLQQMVELSLEEYYSVCSKHLSITNTQKKVDLTELKLKDHVQRLERANLELQSQLNNKIDPQTMLASVQVLKDSSKGQMLLIQKVEYAKERLKIQKQQHSELTNRFKEIQTLINQQIQKVERYNQLTRDVKDQQFQIERNNQLLKMYQQRMEKLRANDYAIKSLKQGMKKTDLTAKQALILLQDAKYKAKLRQYTVKQKAKPDHQNSFGLLQKIQNAAKIIDKQQQQFQFSQPYEFKLQALRDEIALVDRRIADSKK